MHDDGMRTTEHGVAVAGDLPTHTGHNPHAARVRHAVTPWLNGADILVYALVGIVFLAGALAMLGYTVVTFFQSVHGNFPRQLSRSSTTCCSS